VLTLPPGALPSDLDALLGDGALLVSLERLPDGRVVVQPLPDVDPALVARVRKILAQHADVLRRLT
jgi:hypothetical protein